MQYGPGCRTLWHCTLHSAQIYQNCAEWVRRKARTQGQDDEERKGRGGLLLDCALYKETSLATGEGGDASSLSLCLARPTVRRTHLDRVED